MTAPARSVGRIRRSSRIDPRRSAPSRWAPYSEAPPKVRSTHGDPGEPGVLEIGLRQDAILQPGVPELGEPERDQGAAALAHDHVPQRGLGHVEAGEAAPDELD